LNCTLMFKKNWIKVLGIFCLFVFVVLGNMAGCGDNDGGDPIFDGEPEITKFTIRNQQEGEATVYISFAETSCVRPEAWSSFCNMTDSGNCNFKLEGEGTENDSRVLPLTREPNCTDNSGNFTIFFNAPPSQSCDKTQVEANFDINGMDNYDISLVNGFNEPVSIEVSPGMNAGPVTSMDGNQEVPGVFPLGCDACAERLKPPCGYTPGDNGECHAGTQFDPKPPCQFFQVTGGSITLNLLKKNMQ